MSVRRTGTSGPNHVSGWVDAEEDARRAGSGIFGLVFGTAVARFLPLGSRVMEGAVQQVIGTGSTGHVTSVGGKNIQLNRPEGVAVHSSTAFVADTMNHRIIMVPILEYEPLGCFKEVTVEGESTLVPTLEGDMEARSRLIVCSVDDPRSSSEAVARCAHATMRKAPTPRSAPLHDQETMKAINASCRSKGGHYAGYSCKVVSWDDVSRGTGPSGLSCWGANITDTYLKSRSGTPLFTLRADNWNERLGIIDAQRVALVAPGAPGLSAPGEAPTLRPVTLQRVLKEMGRYGHYAGLASDVDLSDALRDTKCSIRFQTTFLPVEASDTRPAVLEFATEAYNYNTMRDEDPRNLVLLCTSQGIAVQQDGRGAKKLFHHAADPSGRIHRYWLEAEETHHKVGGEQRETDAERAVALARGKATASVIGIPAMGQRFNVLMTIQVPLRQVRCEREESHHGRKAVLGRRWFWNCQTRAKNP
ncbi:Uncharacterized protein R588, partial [Durusdinium trenchii]